MRRAQRLVPLVLSLHLSRVGCGRLNVVLVLWGKLYEMFPELHWQLLRQRDRAAADGAARAGALLVSQCGFGASIRAPGVDQPRSAPSQLRLQRVPSRGAC